MTQPRRSLFIPATMTIIMVAILLGLGTWQMQRREWKRGILDAIDRAEQSPPIPLPQEPAPFTKVTATGHYLDGPQFQYSVELRYADTARQKIGAWLLAPMQLDDGRIVLIDRGWAPDDAPPKLPQGEVSVTGFIRPAETAPWFGPADDLPRRHIYALNPMTIARALNMPLYVTPSGMQPYTLVILGEDTSTPPIPSTKLPRPPNDHLSYALTWYSFAAILIVIFLAFARKQRAA